MKFSLFFIAEYANMVTASALIATLFFGGWDIPFTSADNTGAVAGLLVLLSALIFIAKVMFFLFFFIWVRWTLPRFRYDQLMSLGWKVLLPLAIAYIIIVATLVLVLDNAGLQRGFTYGLILFAVNAVMLFILFFVLDRGRIVSPAYRGADAVELARLRGITAARSRLTSPQSGGVH
jgi:NADH-quinone oxidoreductase subunit H